MALVTTFWFISLSPYKNNKLKQKKTKTKKTQNKQNKLYKELDMFFFLFSETYKNKNNL